MSVEETAFHCLFWHQLPPPRTTAFSGKLLRGLNWVRRKPADCTDAKKRVHSVTFETGIESVGARREPFAG